MWFAHKQVILTKNNLLKRWWVGSSRCCFCDHDETIQPLLQDAANATLRSETLSRNCVQCINHKRGCKKPIKKVQNVCNGGCIKHGSDFSCVCNPGRTVQSNEPFAMRRNKRNGQPDEGMCDRRHTVHSDELFVIRQHQRNGKPDEGVCDIQHTVH